MRKIVSVCLILMLAVGAVPSTAAADDAVTHGGASLLIPGLGQYLNGEHETKGGKVKMGFMALAELGAILTTSIVGANAGYPEVWSGIGIFIANHLYSATDAYVNAKDGE